MAKPRPVIHRPLLMWLALPVLCLLPALAMQAATLRAYVQPDRVRPNQTATYVITVQDGSVERLSELRLPLQLQQVSAVSSSQQFSVINGRQSASVRLSWQIVGSEPGEFVIPPQTLKISGQDVSTNEVKLTVVQGGGDDPALGNEDEASRAILQLEPGKKELYQGEVMPLNCSLYIPRDMQLRRLGGLIDIEKNDLAIARFPQQADQSMTVINGVGYTVLTFRSTLSSLRTGEITVGPATMEILVEVPVEQGRGRPNMFPPGFPQGFFGVPTEPRKIRVESHPVKLNVLPLPAEGRPENFSGAVGDFVLTASATPTELTVGDPVAVELVVEGSGNFDALTAPALVSPSGWKSYPAKRYSIEGQIDQNQVPTLERKIGYSQVFIPEAVHNELPPFEISYFSSVQKKYVTLRTEAIPLNMKPAPVETGGEVAAGASSPEILPPVADPVPDITDIVVNPPSTSRWVMPTGSLLVRSSLFWSLQAVPVGLFALACFMAAMRRKRETRMAGRAGELRAAWAGLEKHGLDDSEFLRQSARFIYLAKGAEPVKEPELLSILERYQNLNFSAGQPAPAAAPERQKWLRSLRTLYQSALARATLVVLGLFCLGGSLQAQETSQADQTYQEAVAEMEKGDYARAQYHAESLTKKKPPFLSSEVFQLIGHARYRQEDLGRAVLWYERARLLSPRSPELRQNLRHLHEKLRYVSFQADNPLHEWSLWLKPNQWVMAAAAGGWLVFLSLAFRVLAPRRSSWAVALSVIGLLIALPSTAMAALRPAGVERIRDVLVITANDVSAFTGASVTSGTVMELPEGSQVRLLEQRGAWNYVEIPNRPENLRGWVENAATTPLWVWDEDLVP